MCCTPYVATIVAAIFCIFQSFVNLCWNVPMIIGIALNKTEVLSLTPIDFQDLENPFLVYGITILLAIVNLQLLIVSCLLLKANHDKKTDLISAWCILVLLKSLVNVSLGSYFICAYGTDLMKRITLFRLAALFSGIFFIWPTVNIALVIMVLRRYRDIASSRSLVSRVDASPPDDSQPPPYTPGAYGPRQQSLAIDPAQITGWSHQPLLDFEQEEEILIPNNP